MPTETFLRAERQVVYTMPHDALVGARYKDSIYDSNFTIVSVHARDEDTSRITDDSDILVEMDYDEFDSTIEVTLEQFREDETIELLSIPSELSE